MLYAFHISASGMEAHQVNIDVIANNLSNANTTAYKKGKVEFKDLMYRDMAAAQRLMLQPDIDNPMGLGTAAASVQKIFSQGEIRNTERNLDLAIQGNGFFEVLSPEGEYLYTRTGNLQVNREGLLETSEGYLLSPSIQLPPDTEEVVITDDGIVFVQVPGQRKAVEVGRIELANFMNPSGLTPLGDNLYQTSNSSGQAFYGEPGEEAFGIVSQGFLEGSNVSFIEELTGMMLAQRGYEMNAKMIQTADEIMGIINNLRR